MEFDHRLKPGSFEDVDESFQVYMTTDLRPSVECEIECTHKKTHTKNGNVLDFERNEQRLTRDTCAEGSVWGVLRCCAMVWRGFGAR